MHVDNCILYRIVVFSCQPLLTSQKIAERMPPPNKQAYMMSVLETQLPCFTADALFFCFPFFFVLFHFPAEICTRFSLGTSAIKLKR